MTTDPYKSPTTPPEKPRPSGWRIATSIVLAILAIPAALVAFCATCTAAAILRAPDPLPLTLGGIATAAALAGMVYLIFWRGRK